MADDTKLLNEENESGEVEMTFLEHLEELRWRIIYSLIGILIGAIIAWVFIDFIIDGILLLPARQSHIKLQNLRPFGQLFLYFQVAIIVGLIFSFPNVVYQFWKFIAPALKENEKKYITSIVIFTTFCFLAGVVFAYFVMLPLTLKFAAEFGSEAIENNFAIDEYFSIILSVIIGAGLVFELPMLSFFLTKIGILNPGIMRRYRRHAIVAILILAAILTPGTDPVSQIILAVPLVFLYEISILVSKIFQKKN
ncbi:Sec-independent protein translocase protein TatC [Melioribacter roseus P3M-2]|uniref:Sec-independent protein translocase protein TatC n=1 Tax=Melioribacter roseus (strain DSM 23840 / JCM 17771 / VKM B-2668 / P3M-2) TaxID=1191523 RepID=I6ZZY4_MELRP|nr:twin-arginine translocase subunit TatC [Melioribacter roseus]AFN73291.1 Sec-independent protein translocase protein TatC [Melioribacter roseus P3M-2]